MRTARATALLAGALVLCGLPAGPAMAQSGSAIDQYIEHVPSAGGDEPSSSVDKSGDGEGDGSGSGSSGGAVSPATQQELEQMGEDGAAAAALAQATAPEGASKRGGRGSGSGGNDREAGDDEGSGVPPVGAAIGEAADGDGSGMGIVLPILLGVTLVGGIGAWLVRRRRGAQST